MKSKSLQILSILLLGVATQAPGAITTLIDESFGDGGRTNGTDANDAAWYYRGIGTGLTIASGGGLTNALSFNSNNNVNSFVAALPQTVTLANNGDYLSVTYSYSRSATTNFHSGMRVGFFSIDTVPTADNFTTGFDAALGYTAELPAEGQTNRTLRLREDTDAAANRLMDAQNTTTGALFTQASSAIFVPSSGSASLPLAVTFTLTRVATGLELKVGSSLGETTYAVIDTASPYYSFNSIGFGQIATNQVNYWDNIVVTTNVPEPQAALLGGLGLLVLLRRRR